ncbi:MAG: hypothetical protein QY306_17170 [Anaerolineales bacterium]|nr:MAG: hypothetical protein QY306_17170 [Anaerolineales bacterium]
MKEVHTLPLDAVVTVCGFTCLLWWIPKAEIRALPILCAWTFAPYWVEASWYAYVTALMLGTLFMLIDAMGVFRDTR